MKKLLLLAALSLAACGKHTPPAEAESSEHHDDHEESVVTLTPENLRHLDLKTEPVATGRLELTLKTAGRVTENTNKTARVASTLEGRLTRLNFDLNDPVKAGDVLALVQSPELLGRQLELKAPIDGIVVQRAGAIGELVGRDTAVYTISDPADLWVIAEVKERDLAAVKVGQPAAFKVLAYPDKEFHGTVTRLANELEADTRTLEVRIETANTDRLLKPGMFADIEITTTVTEDALLIPDTALQSGEDAPIVFVALGDNKFEKRPVTPGLARRGRVQVLDGLKAGDNVVTDGSFILKSELLKGDLGEHSH